MARRLQGMGQPKYADGFQVRTHSESLNDPLRWRKPKMVFVNSMSDLFHKEVPIGFLTQVFTTMNLAEQHVFQILTKRSENLLKLAPLFYWTPNIWMGVTVESDKYVERIVHLKATPAKIKFLSLEPLLGPLGPLDLQGIHWVIVGGESGPGARPMKEEWVIDIRDRCVEAKVPFFFKQWGGVRKKETGRLLQGTLWDQMPEMD